MPLDSLSGGRPLGLGAATASGSTASTARSPSTPASWSATAPSAAWSWATALHRQPRHAPTSLAGMAAAAGRGPRGRRPRLLLVVGHAPTTTPTATRALPSRQRGGDDGAVAGVRRLRRHLAGVHPRRRRASTRRPRSTLISRMSRSRQPGAQLEPDRPSTSPRQMAMMESSSAPPTAPPSPVEGLTRSPCPRAIESRLNFEVGFVLDASTAGVRRWRFPSTRRWRSSPASRSAASSTSWRQGPGPIARRRPLGRAHRR